MPHISVGDILRRASKESTWLGKTIRGYIERGELVPDNIVIDIVSKYLLKEECKRGYVLDGFPRTLGQAEALEQIAPPHVVVYLNAPDEVIIERISGRLVCLVCGAVYHTKWRPPKVEGVCDNCGTKLVRRVDDRPGIVRKRLRVSRTQLAPVIEFYRLRGILVEVDASEDSTAVIPRVIRLLEEFFAEKEVETATA